MDDKARAAAMLRALETEHKVDVLFAAEAGSRAWGFASLDSDYDIRGFFAHGRNWYLSIEEKRDVIERIALPLDVSLWDFRKTLRLARRSNPALWEWLVSSIVYRIGGDWAQELTGICREHYSLRRMAESYVGIVRQTWKTSLERTTLPNQKRYFYAIRPLLAAQYILQHRRMPPITLAELRAAVRLPDAVSAEIDWLLAVKLAGVEADATRRLAAVDAWVSGGMDLALYAAIPERTVPLALLDDLYRRVIGCP